MNRNTKWLLLLLLWIFYPELAHSNATEAPRPNMIIFLTDDLGYGDLGSYGHPFIQTPHLDRFAEEGVRMTDMHAAATVCSPSRAAILTGRNGYRSGFYNIAGFFGTTLSKQEITLAQLLQDVGYQTAFFGKWHLSKLESHDEVSVNEMGFDYSLATSVNAFGTGPKNPEKFMRNGVPEGMIEGWYADIVSREASDWIANKRDKNKPFFVIISTNEPHTPIDPPQNFAEMYASEDGHSLAQQLSYGRVKRHGRDIAEYAKEYYGTVSQVDHVFGGLMDFIERQGLKDSTLVIFTSDNGPEYPVTLDESNGEWEDPIRDRCFGSPGPLRGMKRFPYEGGHRVPGLIRWPGHIPAGTVSDQLFNGTDFLPTLCKLAGADVPQDRTIDGTDAFNAFLGKDYERKILPIWFFLLNASHMPGMAQMAMRYQDYVLVGKLAPRRENFTGYPSADTYPAVDWLKTSVPDTFELYHIKDDPGQCNDISSEKYDTFIELIPKMQTLWLDIRNEGPWWGRLSGSSDNNGF